MISRHKLTLLLFVSAFIIIAILLSACNGSRSAAQPKSANASPTPEVVQVTTAAAITRDLPRFVEATGSLNADEQTDVAPTVSGKVVSISVDLGSYVQKGAVLVRLDDADARLRLEQLQAQAQQAQAAVRQAEEKIGLRPGQAFDPNRVAEVGAARAAMNSPRSSWGVRRACLNRATCRARLTINRRRNAISCSNSTRRNSPPRGRTSPRFRRHAPPPTRPKRRSSKHRKRSAMPSSLRPSAATSQTGPQT